MATSTPHGSGPNPIIHMEPAGAHGEFRMAGPTHDLLVRRHCGSGVAKRDFV